MKWIVLALVAIGQPFLGAADTGTPRNYLMGRADSPVRIDIFSDFECPACRTFYLDTVTPLLDQYSSGNKVAVVFHEYPLPNHPSAKTASLYSAASAHLGREQFIKVVNYLYTCQAEWAYDGRVDRVVARVLSADDMAKVQEKVKDPALEQEIAREVAVGTKQNVTSTPTFFVTMQGKEQRIVGGMPYSLLNSFIAPNVK